MISKRIFMTFVALLVIPFVAVAASDKSKENVISEARELGAFDRIFTKGSHDVEIRIGSTQSVVIEASPDILSRMITSVEDGQLRIYRKSGSGRRERGSWRGAFVTITVPSLNALRMEGSGDVDTSGIEAAAFDVDQEGSGDLEISGNCGLLTINHEGSGDIDARQFSCTGAVLELEGSGDVEISISGSLELDHEGSGDLDIWGSPQLSKFKFSGSGEFEVHQ